jgi:hypothetical protein
VLRLQQGRTGEALSGFTAAAAHDPRMTVARRNVEVTAWKLLQRVTLALWITTWVASALSEDRGGDSDTFAVIPASASLAPILGAIVIVFLGVSSWRTIPVTARPFVRRLPVRRPWMLASLIFAGAGAGCLVADAAAGSAFRHGLGATLGFLVALAAVLCALIGGSRAHALSPRLRR